MPYHMWHRIWNNHPLWETTSYQRPVWDIFLGRGSTLMITSWHGDAFCSTGHLFYQSASNRVFMPAFLWCEPEKTVEQIAELLVIWDTVTCMWLHSNDIDGLVQKRHDSIANALELRLFCVRQHHYAGVYTKFSGRLSEEPFPWLIQKFPCILIFKTGQPGCQLNLSEGQIRLDLTRGRPLV